MSGNPLGALITLLAALLAARPMAGTLRVRFTLHMPAVSMPGAQKWRIAPAWQSSYTMV